MKNLFSLVIAGIIGGLITLGGLQFMTTAKNNSKPTLEPSAQIVTQNLNAAPRANAVPFDFSSAAEKVMPVVVHIDAGESTKLANQRKQKERKSNPFGDFFGDSPLFGPDQKRGIGSGVIISADGYIVTNNHVVEFADEFEVTLFDNRAYAAKLVGTYPQADLAVIKIDASNLPVLDYADSDQAKVGQWVLAVGNPLELNSTVTAGIISAKGRSINIIGNQDRRAIESFIQTDAAVNPGNSGGALVDAQGRLLGINTAIASRTGYFSGYSFAIPVNLMTKIANDIIKFGSFQRAFLGIDIQELDNELATDLGINITQGIVVQSLMDGGSAQYAGVLPKDVIIKVDRKVVKSVPQLQELIGRATVGQTITLTVNRNGKVKEIPVRLKAG
ncbi:MAG: S1C family serine protease [Saprospiraceae bacterium]